MNVLIWEITCLALVWAVFCRLVFVDKTTKPVVRFVLRLSGMGALLGAGMPFYGWVPSIEMLVVICPAVLSEVVLSQYWKYGMPIQYMRDAHRPKRRIGDI